MLDKTRFDKRLAWSEVNLSNIDHNINVIKSYANSPHTKVMAVVKGDAYGHGIIEVSKQVVKSGVDSLGVAFVEEAIKLREANIGGPIYILREAPLGALEDAIKYNLVLTVNSYEMAEVVSEKCSSLGKKIIVHINVDTGLNRLGINFKDAIHEIVKIVSLPNIEVEGVFTHFSAADEKDNSSYTKLQWSRFNKIIQELEKLKIKIDIFHCANSATTFRYKEMHLGMVRPGLAIYGLNPFPKQSSRWLREDICDVVSNLKPAFSLKAKIFFIKNVQPGEYISYNLGFKTKRESIIAIVPIGYSNGYSRLLSNKSKILIDGKYAPVVGNVCMDLFMIDITDIASTSKVSFGSEVIIIGKDGEREVSVEDLADLMGTIKHEIVTSFKNNIPRIYIK